MSGVRELRTALVAVAGIVATLAVTRCDAGPGHGIGTSGPRAGARGWRALARGLGRPFVLPFLWSRLASAERAGEPEAAIGHLESVTEWLPRWTDGRALFAWQLVQARDRANLPDESPAVTARRRAERLVAATAWLIERAEQERASQARAELFTTAAFLLEVEGGRPATAAAVRRMTGRDPLAWSDTLLARAIEARPSSRALAERRAFLVFQRIAAALRAGDRDRARRAIESGRQRLLEVRADSARADALRALDLLESWFEAPTPETLEDLKNDPYLAPLVPWLR